MQSSNDTAGGPEPPSRHGSRIMRKPVLAACALALAAAASAAWAAPGWTAWALAGLGGFALGSIGRRAGAARVPAAGMPDEGDACALVSHVMPVWQRTAELARTTAERDADALAGRFASVHSQLDIALSATAQVPTLDGRAIDELLERHGAEIDRLRLDARQALDTLGEVLGCAGRIEASTGALDQAAGELKRLASGTHLLGLNASVEAARSGASHGSFTVVAQDVRDLARHLAALSARFETEARTLQEQVQALRTMREDAGVDDETLELRTQINARAVLRSLLGSLGEAARGSQVLREAGQQAQGEIEAILIGLQGHDRVNQMLNSVIGDMGRMGDVLKTGEIPASPAEWLSRLESTYTMEDMRTSHHDTQSIDARPGVEFF